MVHKSFEMLKKYCEQEEYAGWDNFDGLNSKLLSSTPLYKSKFIRLAWIQFFKRFPVNLRRVAFVPKSFNPKGLALFASGLLNSGNVSEARILLDKLRQLRCDGYSGACWGYNFDWQSRGHLTTYGTPNIVTTVFVANAFLDSFEINNEEECVDLAEEACRFFLENLILFEDEKSLCFGYMPGASGRVHNVNMMAAALLARVYSITGDKEKLEISRKSMAYSIKALGDEAFWPYGEFNYHGFIDNFHTGFNLVSLGEWMKFTGEYIWLDELNRAYKYYIDSFWLDEGCPKYYNNSLYPIDIHCSAQGVVTFIKLSEFYPDSIKMAKKILSWAIDNMQDETGYFYYQKKKYYTNKISYMRWSQAWMFYAISLFENSQGHQLKSDIPQQ